MELLNNFNKNINLFLKPFNLTEYTPEKQMEKIEELRKILNDLFDMEPHIFRSLFNIKNPSYIIDSVSLPSIFSKFNHEYLFIDEYKFEDEYKQCEFLEELYNNTNLEVRNHESYKKRYKENLKPYDPLVKIKIIETTGDIGSLFKLIDEIQQPGSIQLLKISKQKLKDKIREIESRSSSTTSPPTTSPPIPSLKDTLTIANKLIDNIDLAIIVAKYICYLQCRRICLISLIEICKILCEKINKYKDVLNIENNKLYEKIQKTKVSIEEGTLILTKAQESLQKKKSYLTRTNPILKAIEKEESIIKEMSTKKETLDKDMKEDTSRRKVIGEILEFLNSRNNHYSKLLKDNENELKKSISNKYFKYKYKYFILKNINTNNLNLEDNSNLTNQDIYYKYLKYKQKYIMESNK